MTLTADYHNKNTDGMLVESTANQTTGTAKVWQKVVVIIIMGLNSILSEPDSEKGHFVFCSLLIFR